MTHADTKYAIGIDLGGTRIKVVAVDPNGQLMADTTAATDDADPEWPQRVRAVCEQVEAGQQSKAEWIGLAAPGLAAPDGRCIDWMPGRLPGLEALEWADVLKRKHPVPVLNDAQAALLGEVWKGAAKGCANVAMLTLGTGVGGAVICDGRLLKGHIGRAGHLGHMSLDPDGTPDICGTPGSLEDAIGECSVAHRSSGRFTTTEDVVAAHLHGDTAATQVWMRSVDTLACAIVSIINIVDPEVIVLGGGIAKAGDALLDPLRKHLDRSEWRPGGCRVDLRLAAMGGLAGAYGAAYNALSQ